MPDTIVVVLNSAPTGLNAEQGEIVVVSAGDAGPTGAQGAQGVPGISGDHDGLINTDNPESHPQYKPINAGFFLAGGLSGTTISFVDGTRTFTISPTGPDFSFYSNETLYTKSTPQTIVISDTDGPHWIYFDNTGTLVETTVFQHPPIYASGTVCAIVYWNVAEQEATLFIDERHGRTMDSTTHWYLHSTIGAAFNDGLELTNILSDGDGSLDQHAQFGVENGSFFDEDLLIAIVSGSPQSLAPAGQFPILARDGAAGVWRRYASNNFAVRTTGSGRAAWNEEVAGVWQLSEVAEGGYIVMHVMATGDETTPIFLVMGQEEFATLPDAEEEARSPQEGAFLADIEQLTLEFVRIASIVLQTSSTYTNTVESRIVSLSDGSDYADWRRRVNPTAGVATSTDHQSLTNRGATDAHSQYQLTSEKGAALGYASLDGSGDVPDAQIPATITRDTELTAAIAAHEAAADPHPGYLTPAEGNAAYDALGAAAAAVLAHEGAGDPHPTYTTAAELAAAIAVHEAAADPHIGYQKESEKGVANGYAELDGSGYVPDLQINPLIARDAEVTAAIAAHAVGVDPHTIYQKESEKGVAGGYASLDGLGVVPDAQISSAITRDTELTAAIAAHEAAADPHLGYQKESEKGAVNGYASLDGSGFVPDAQIAATIARDTEITAAIAAHEAAGDPHAVYVLHTEVDDTPVNGATTDPISSNWAYDHLNDADVHAQYAFRTSALYSGTYNEFYQANNNGDLTFFNTGTASGNSVGTSTTTARPGVVDTDTGTTASGNAGWGTSGGSSILLGGGTWTFECGLRTPASLSDGTVDYTLRVGFLDAHPGTPVDGVFFRHVNGQANWRCITRSNSVETDTDSSVVVAVSTYYRFQIIVNAAASSVQFLINGSLVATVATNIPSGAGRETGFGAHVQKNATGSGGGTNRVMQTDYMSLVCQFSANRS